MKRDSKKNTTAVNFQVGDKVKVTHETKKDLVVGWVRAIVPPIGTGGEWSYSIWWLGIKSEGCGWEDTSLKKA